MPLESEELRKTDLGPKPRLEFHPPTNLIVDERYQRTVSGAAGKRLIRKIVSEFHWPYFGVIAATDNGDGTYCVIDGQHRAEAARQHPEVHSVPVMVIEEMTLSEQARAFVEINQSRVRLSALQIHRAAVRAGDPVAVDIDRVATECGVIIPVGNVPSSEMIPGQTLSVKSLYAVYKDHGPARLRNTLMTIMAAYRNTTGDLRAQLIKGVALALGDAPEMSAKITLILSQTDAVSWIERAQSQSKVSRLSTAAQLAQLLISSCHQSSSVKQTG